MKEFPFGGDWQYFTKLHTQFHFRKFILKAIPPIMRKYTCTSLIIATLFVIAKYQELHKGPSLEDWLIIPERVP